MHTTSFVTTRKIGKIGKTMEPIVAWAWKNWIISTFLAMAVGGVQVVRSIAIGEQWPMVRVLSKVFSSILGGTATVFLSLGLHFNNEFVYFAAMLGSHMGYAVFEIGEAQLKKKGYGK